MRRKPPPIAVGLGLGGLIPFLVCGFAAVWLRNINEQALALDALIAYAATILSFVGAIHWGIALEDQVGLADFPRYGLGVIPALVGWIAIVLTFAAHSDEALAVLATGFLGVVLVEQRGERSALQPPAYLGLRWILTVIVVAVLLAVLIIRATGLHVH